jgi:hypothetical protein
MRRAGYLRTRLTPLVTIVYAARIAAFRLYALRWRGDHAVILDRYFYDVLTHYRIDGIVARVCFLFLHGVIPRPSVAILLQASAETLAERRPEYAAEYLSAAFEAYRALLSDFPELAIVHTDNDSAADAHIEALVRRRLKGWQPASRVSSPRQ